MNSYRFNNIRTLGFYFDNMFHIYDMVKQYIEKCKTNKDYIYSSLCRSVITACVEMKMGYSLEEILADKMFDYNSFEKDDDNLFQKNLHLEFDFINEYL